MLCNEKQFHVQWRDFQMNVLVCDDERQIVNSVIETLKKKTEGTQISSRFYGVSQPSQIDFSRPYDIALLDIDMIRSRTFLDGSKGFVLFSEEYKKSEPFSYRKKVRILLLWYTSRDSNPGPTDQEKPMCNIRQFSKSRSFVVFGVLS